MRGMYVIYIYIPIPIRRCTEKRTVHMTREKSSSNIYIDASV